MKVDIKHEHDDKKGIIIARSEGENIGEMAYHTETTKIMSINHTEVKEAERGNKIGIQILDFAVDYARKNDLQIKPVCKFVHTMFRKFPDNYGDIIFKQTP